MNRIFILIISTSNIYYKLFKMLYLFLFYFILLLAALGFCCCARTFSGYIERGLLFVAVHGLLIVVASRCGARALGVWASVVAACGLSSCGTWALERRLGSCGMCALEHVGFSSCGTWAQ